MTHMGYSYPHYSLPTPRSCARWFRQHVSVWITHVNSFHCLGTLSASTCSLTFNFISIQFLTHPSPNSLFSHYHTALILTPATVSLMSDICGHKPSCSPSLSVHHKRARDLSDEPMSPGDRVCCRSDKRRVAHLPSPHHHRSPSREGHHKKCHRVTSHNISPSSTQWVATTTGLLVHDPQDCCPECLEYQRHVSLDLILETLSIMVAHEDSLKSLACLLGWSGCMANLKDDLVEMHRDCDHWCRQAEEAEMVLAVLKQQEAAAFEQAHCASK